MRKILNGENTEGLPKSEGSASYNHDTLTIIKEGRWRIGSLNIARDVIKSSQMKVG